MSNDDFFGFFLIFFVGLIFVGIIFYFIGRSVDEKEMQLQAVAHGNGEYILETKDPKEPPIRVFHWIDHKSKTVENEKTK